MAGPNFDPYNLIGNIGTRAAQTQQQAGSLGDIVKKGRIERRLGEAQSTAASALETLKGRHGIQTELAKHGYIPTSVVPSYGAGIKGQLKNMRGALDFSKIAKGISDTGAGGFRVNPTGPMGISDMLKNLKFSVGLPVATQTQAVKPTGKRVRKEDVYKVNPQGVMTKGSETITTPTGGQTAKQSAIGQLKIQFPNAKIEEAEAGVVWVTPDGKHKGTTFIMIDTSNDGKHDQAFVIDDDGGLHALSGTPKDK